jgi:hypothetical protein
MVSVGYVLTTTLARVTRRPRSIVRTVDYEQVKSFIPWALAVGIGCAQRRCPAFDLDT